MKLNEFEQFADKNILVQQFVKFIKPEHVEGLLNGMLYMNPLKVFIEQEEREKKKGQGDKYEGRVVGHVERMEIRHPKHDDTVLGVIEGKRRVTFNHPESPFVPIFCYTAFQKENLEVVAADEDYAFCRISICEEDRQKFLDNFGSKAVILPPDFYENVRGSIDSSGDQGLVQPVRYVDYNFGGMYEEQLRDFIESSLGLAYWKDDYFVYQREARIALANRPTDIGFSYSIGNFLRECHVVDSADLLDANSNYFFRLPLK